METHDRIIDYIIEQADRNDTNNLQFEQDILFEVNKKTDLLISRIMSNVTGFSNLLEMNSIIMRIEHVFTNYHNAMVIILRNSFADYTDMAYKQSEDLIELGKFVEGKLEQNVKELQNEASVETVKFIQDHAFEQLKGYETQKIQQIRSVLGDLYLKKTVDKATVRAKIEKILDTNRSKAEEIAQTELSRAFNYGVIASLESYAEQNPGVGLKKYWHGFKFSVNTCTYCRPRIGQVYDLYDSSEVLPAHIRCRCIWLPMFEGWDQPISKQLISRANPFKIVYSDEQMYSRINSRLNISYGENINKSAITSYLQGDRSQKVMQAISDARKIAVDTKQELFNIPQDTSKGRLSSEFNSQIGFWKTLVASAVVDRDTDLLKRSYEAIKGVMILPWNNTQLSGWDQLLRKIEPYI